MMIIMVMIVMVMIVIMMMVMIMMLGRCRRAPRRWTGCRLGRAAAG